MKRGRRRGLAAMAVRVSFTVECSRLFCEKQVVLAEQSYMEGFFGVGEVIMFDGRVVLAELVLLFVA